MSRLLTLLLLILTAWPAWGYKLALVEYTTSGSVSDNRDITVTPSFPIHAAIIKCSASNAAVWSVTGMGADASAVLNSAGSTLADAIQSMGTGTLQLGTAAQVQPVSSTCWIAAFGDDGRQDLAYGTYTGNSTDDRTNAFTTSFTPGMALIQCFAGTCSGGSAFRTTAHSGDSSSRGNNNTDIANMIQSFHSAGVSLGDHGQVNTTGQTYAYLVIKTLSGFNLGGSHVGDANDDVDIAAIADPTFLLAKANSATQVMCGRWGSTGDVSWILGASASGANRIQAFTSTGFQRGTVSCINESGITTRWFVTKAPTYPRGGARPIFFP